MIISTSGSQAQTTDLEKKAINTLLTAWHKAASDVDYDAYFRLMTDTAIFIGTDATENWDKNTFKAYAKPHFDKGRAWSFTALERNIYVDSTQSTVAWFDEHLNTQMGICRGSGILKKINDEWKVQHYVLSIAIPNKHVTTLTEIKKEWDELQIEKMINKN